MRYFLFALLLCFELIPGAREADARQKIHFAELAVVNKTTVDFEAVAVIHLPGRTLEDQWADPKDGVWKDENKVLQGKTSRPKQIRFVTGTPVVSKAWWTTDWYFVAFSYKDKKGRERVMASAPANFQREVDILAKIAGAAAKDVGSTQLKTTLTTALNSTNPTTGLLVPIVTGIYQAVIGDPNKYRSRAGFTAQILKAADAEQVTKVIISEEKNQRGERTMSLRIATPRGSTSRKIKFNERAIDLMDLYKAMLAKVSGSASKEKDK